MLCEGCEPHAMLCLPSFPVTGFHQKSKLWHIQRRYRPGILPGYLVKKKEPNAPSSTERYSVVYGYHSTPPPLSQGASPGKNGTVAKRKFCSSPLFTLCGSFLLHLRGGRIVFGLFRAWQSRPRGFSRPGCGKLFEFYVLRNFFLGIMGFQPSFLLLHPSLLEIET